MARLPNFLVIIRSEKLSGKGQGRGVGVRKKERFVLGKRTFRSQKSKHFVLRIIFGEKDHQCEFRSVTEEEYFRTIDVNLKSTILISELAAARMAQYGGGNILNISSICGVSRNHYYTPYGISKTGVIRFTEQLSAAYKGRGVIVNSIAPGSVATAMNHSRMNDNIASFHPLNHIIFSEQIAALAAFMIGNVSKFQVGEVKKACATESV